MKTTEAFNTTLLFYPKQNPRMRFFALWYFLVLMIIWNVLGHTVLGFEQAWAAPVLAVLVGITVQFLLEWIHARAHGRPPRFAAGVGPCLSALPAAMIPAFACAMLLYPNERVGPILFAVVLSLSSKVLLRAPVGEGQTQHIFNPSNFGVAATLLLFPQVGFAPPYHFTENLGSVGDWVLPLVVLFTGVIIHALFTGRLPLVAAWLIGFVVQGLVRSQLAGAPFYVPLTPMTSAAFILFTLYMIPDPATTPLKPWRQVAFGFSVAMVYGVIQLLHLVFGLFFALLSVCAVRGLSLHLWWAWKRGQRTESRQTADKPEPPLLGPAPQPS